MANDINVSAPNQGTTDAQWKEIFLDNSGNPTFFGIGGSEPRSIVDNIITSLLALATIMAIIMVILSAWSMVTSGGSDEKYARGKTGLINAVIGVIVLIAMWGIIAAVRRLVTSGVS